jgi:selenocysteine-specific elongation factor
METIGGGIILDSIPKKRISRNEEALNALKIREQGSAKDLTNLAAYDLGGVFSEADLCKRADLDKHTCAEAIEVLITDGSIIKLIQSKYISSRILSKLSKECIKYLESYHKSFPLRVGMNIAELRQKLIPDADTTEANAVLKQLNDNGVIRLSEKTAALPDFSVSYSPTQGKIHEKLIKELTDCKYDVKSPDELSALFSKNEKREFEQVFESMISSGELVMISQQIFWLRSTYDKAVKLIRSHFDVNDEVTLAQCRDMLGTSRKYALALLEHLDGKQATKLHGDARRIAKGF